MTVNYTADVANGSSFGCFWKILLRWKGSVYKLIWRELLGYLFLYFTLSLSYRFGMDPYQRSIFEKVKVYCSRQIESIPMSFVLGFYVTLIVKRWWDQYWILPLPDAVALFISSSIHGQDERGRILRRTIMRYVVLAYIIMIQRISFRVKKRFPTLQHLVDSGLMMESEKKIFDNLNAKTTVNKFWIPIIWSTNLVNRARVEGRIHSDHMVQSILTELNEFRRRLGRINVYDNISVPLVYTQVVTMAVYTYFIAALLGHQWVQPYDTKTLSTIYPAQEFDLYFPIFLCLQFVFYIGWLKVAETLINPFGEDDDDFEINWLIDRHLQVSYLVVDEIHEEHPELLKDQYWDQVVPEQLPYNLASENFRRKEPLGSTASMKIKEKDTVYDHLAPRRHASMIPDEVYADYESVTDSPLVDGRKSWIQRQLSRVESFRSTSSSSSLFNRARLASGHQHNSGHHPHHNVGAGGHRLSLYEKLMNRRSSKEHNAMRYTPKAAPAPLRISEKENHVGSLAPHSMSRPRAPTPEVMKETSNESKFFNSPAFKNAPSPRQLSPATLQNGYGVTGLYPGRMVPTGLGQNHTLAPPYGIPSPRSKSPLSSLYDTNDGSHVMLSPIEENDGSPYSTSSTGRSARSSSNYPTTTAIFGRKQSPSPPHDELPPIPTTDQSSHKSNSNGNQHTRPDTHVIDLSAVTPEVNDLNQAANTHSNNNLSKSDSVDHEDRYMTIAEINDIQDNSNSSLENSNSNQNYNSETSTAANNRQRKKSVMARQNAVIEEEEKAHNNSGEILHNSGTEGNATSTNNLDSTQQPRTMNKNNEYDNGKAEIMLTSDVLGSDFEGNNIAQITTVRDVNNTNGKHGKAWNENNSSNLNSRKVSEETTSNMNNNTFELSNINILPETSGSFNSDVTSRRLSDESIHKDSNQSIPNSRKTSEIFNTQNLARNPRKTSEISNPPSSIANSRKSSNISNSPNSAVNSRKSSSISNNSAAGSRKTSEISNSPNSRKTSQISNNNPTTKRNSRNITETPSAPDSRKTSEIVNGNSVSSSRKVSEMSDFDNSMQRIRKSSEMSNSSNSLVGSNKNSSRNSPTSLSDSRKSSLSSNSTVNVDTRSHSSNSNEENEIETQSNHTKESDEDDQLSIDNEIFEVFV